MGLRGWRSAAVGVVVATMLGAACSSSSDTSSDTTTTKADLSVLGPVERASGDPVKVGYIYAGQAQSIDNTNEIDLAKATAKYVNEHLGGIAGRPMQLVPCEDHLTPAGATDCANQMLADDVSAVLAGNPASPAPIIKLLEPPKVPFFMQTAAEASVLFSTDASVMGNPVAFVAAPVKVAKEDDLKKVALVNVDVPAAAQLKIIAEPMYKQANLGLVTAAVPLGTPDVTPQIQAALSDGAEIFLLAGDVSLCVNTLKALKTLDFKGKVISNVNCLADKSAEAIPGGFDGLYVLNTRIDDPKESEVEVLHAVAAKYAPGTPTNDEGQAVLGYVTTLGFARAMRGLQPSDVSPAGVTAALLGMAPEPVPLLPGQTFQCNRKQSTLTPASCSNGAALITISPSGKATHNETFDATPYL